MPHAVCAAARLIWIGTEQQRQDQHLLAGGVFAKLYACTKYGPVDRVCEEEWMEANQYRVLLLGTNEGCCSHREHRRFAGNICVGYRPMAHICKKGIRTTHGKEDS